MKSMPEPEIKFMDVNKLTKAKTHVRSEYPDDKMEALKSSIGSLGLLNFPKATPNVEVFDGWARVVAYKELGFPRIPVIIARGWSETEQIIASLSENIARSEVSADEMRQALDELITNNEMDSSVIAQMTGLDEDTIYVLMSTKDLMEKIEAEKPSDGEGPIPVYSLEKITEIIEAPQMNKKKVSKPKQGKFGSRKRNISYMNIPVPVPFRFSVFLLRSYAHQYCTFHFHAVAQAPQ